MTRLVAAKERVSTGRSSLTAVTCPALDLLVTREQGRASWTTHALDFGTGKACKGIAAVRRGYQAGLSEVVLGLEVAHLGLVWPVDDADGDGKDGVPLTKSVSSRESAIGCLSHLCFLLDGLVNHIVVLNHLLLGRICQILQASFFLLQIDVAEAAVEEHLTRVQLEHEPELLVVDGRVSAEVEEGVVEVGEGLFEVAEQEVGHALLEVCDGEVLVETDGALVAGDLAQQLASRSRGPGRSAATYGLVVLAERGVDHAHIKQDLGRVRDPLKLLERGLELIVVVLFQGRHPRYYFLSSAGA